MNSAWQLQEAKNKFSEVVEQALNNGPQQITRHGRKTAVVLSFGEYQKIRGQKGTITDFFRNCPVHDIAFERAHDYPRQVEL
ncbi:MAG: prevent-host-death protein [Candidatus Raymondbacteria bacterium RifOxyC12_full_50_8]|uniref:Antitoxin n=1 Tax=Candidatus Raymondbacteria bacterium RIFOXYD12_FULL_49_13 TaxID=1817890 RepID=A0A1F7FLN1_UNCRA|nr:MAG: prevent-host-death protein [Candidatus Raymondbacteria bacterium RIFOXYA2_FULL_49_16]OGK07481.1 MAG: prevent-host-death protein [Candidatus Raymondbacteria bacterium RIFOXYD12_FULL_49_13]OGK07767.1 MAG: prevent-host-death protein [Candidatus Raymondbacteria bacterium RifOxyC12_full_50_8]OGP43837.1 MAG: prevent-host-death protein [Candidatus Raymondbacteria bacterium RIFOXYB2_FULL_49_35]